MKFLMVIAIAVLGSALVNAADKKVQTIELTVTEEGFQPNQLDVKPNTPVVLKITRKTDSTCSKEIIVPVKNIKTDLPLNKTVKVDLGKLEKGEVNFSCGMKMDQGVIHVK